MTVTTAKAVVILAAAEVAGAVEIREVEAVIIPVAEVAAEIPEVEAVITPVAEVAVEIPEAGAVVTPEAEVGVTPVVAGAEVVVTLVVGAVETLAAVTKVVRVGVTPVVAAVKIKAADRATREPAIHQSRILTVWLFAAPNKILQILVWMQDNFPAGKAIMAKATR